MFLKNLNTNEIDLNTAETILNGIENSNYTLEEIISKLENYNIEINDIKKYISNILSKRLLFKNFLSANQHSQLYDECLKTNTENVIKKLKEILTEDQKEKLKTNCVTYEDMVKNIKFYGVNTKYRYSVLKNILRNNNDIKNILSGEKDIDEEAFSIINKKEKTNQTQKENKLPIRKNFTNPILYVKVNTNRNDILSLIKKAQQNFTEIPDTLVLFSSHLPLQLENKPKGSLSDWINNLIYDFDIKTIYWIVPSNCLYNVQSLVYYFGKNLSGENSFHGRYNIDKPDNKPFLEQTVFVDREKGIIKKDLINCQDENSELKNIKIITCTKETLPTTDKNIILDIDGDYFNNCGYKSEYFLEQIPSNIDKIYEDFISVLNQKFKRTIFLTMSVSPEFVGAERIEETQQFFNDIKNTVKSTGKNILN